MDGSIGGPICGSCKKEKVKKANRQMVGVVYGHGRPVGCLACCKIKLVKKQVFKQIHPSFLRYKPEVSPLVHLADSGLTEGVALGVPWITVASFLRSTSKFGWYKNSQRQCNGTLYGGQIDSHVLARSCPSSCLCNFFLQAPWSLLF